MFQLISNISKKAREKYLFCLIVLQKNRFKLRSSIKAENSCKYDDLNNYIINIKTSFIRSI